MKKVVDVPLAANGPRRYSEDAAVQGGILPASTASAAAVQQRADTIGMVVSPCSHIMLLGEGGKCQGPGDSVPGRGPRSRFNFNFNFRSLE